MRLIDADELKERLKEYCIDGDKEAEEYYEIMGIDDCVDEAPTVDAVEVVRCKDCKHWCNEIDEHTYECCTRAIVNRFKPDDFCSYGERKEK